jgi:hypothetical protein
VNDLYENKNLYMVVDNLYNLGGMVNEYNLNIFYSFHCLSPSFRLRHQGP